MNATRLQLMTLTSSSETQDDPDAITIGGIEYKPVR
jgi:hypothetical protein